MTITDQGKRTRNLLFSYRKFFSQRIKRCRVTGKKERSLLLHYGKDISPLTWTRGLREAQLSLRGYML